MDERELLMIPGPTNVSPIVLRALAKPTLSHVSRAFADIFLETLNDLRQIFKSTGLIIPLAGTGTLGAEVGLGNVIEPNDRILAISGGYFGDRLADIANALGAKVDKVQVPWGSTAIPKGIERRLSAANYKAVLVVHVDTSTGAANNIKEIGEITTSKGVLFVVDTVCSLGGMNVEVDNWGMDVCFTGSQKALATPPGLTIVAFSSKAMQAREVRKASMSTYFGDIRNWIPIMQDPAKYFATPPVNMIYALHESCKMILSEGLNARFARHSRLAAAFREGMRALGLKVLCKEEDSASTLTVVNYPEGVNDVEFRKSMEEKYDVVIAGGLGPFKGKAFRVGHMGNVNKNDILSTISAIEGSLAEQDCNFHAGAGTAAANRKLGS